VHDLGLLDDETILDEFSNVTSGVGIRNFGGFVGVKPNLSFTTFKDASSESLLKTE